MTSARRIPIGEYGLIGDTRTAALVATDGSIDWLCLPRFDSPPVFGRLVGGDDAGWFSIRPAEPASVVSRRYRGDTATLETTWAVDGGRLVLADSMVGDVTGRMLPDNMLVRRVSTEGRAIRIRVELRPRFGYNRRPAHRVRRQNGSLTLEHGDRALAVTSDLPDQLTVDSPSAVEITPGRPVTMVVSASHRGPLVLIPPSVAMIEAEGDENRWQRWSDTLLTGPGHRRMLVRSLVTLELLNYSPSGAPVAAPTTSLPEVVGGGRNWDYRFAWPRDASLGISAFLSAGKEREALRFLAWLLHASRLDRPRLPAVFTLHGRPVARERQLERWPGYADSRPVRVGNEARGQHQLDGYGWVLDAAWRLTQSGHRLDGETWRTMQAFTEHVRRMWMRPDAGIWERRDRPRHHVHSKLMAWLALDRATRIAEQRGDSPRRPNRWRASATTIGTEIRSRGFNPEIGAYVGAYGTEELDAATLLIPWAGFEPADSPRVTGSIAVIRERLGAGGPLLYRYRNVDGLDGDEGAFLPCSFWLVDALARTGQRSRAEALFEDLLGLSTDLGLFAEEMNPSTHEHLGNFPQALTHSALLQAASALHDAGEPEGSTPG